MADATTYNIVTVFNGMSIAVDINVNNASSTTSVAASSISSGWAPTATTVPFAMTTNVNQGIFNWGDNSFFVQADGAATGQPFTIAIANTVSNVDSIQLYVFWKGGSDYEVVPLLNGLSSPGVTVTS